VNRGSAFGYRFGYTHQFGLFKPSYANLRWLKSLGLQSISLIYQRFTVFTANSKSAEGNLVGVRPPLPAPIKSTVCPFSQALVGKVVPVDIALQPHAPRFRKGDALCIDIQGRWFFPRSPFFGQFPTTYQGSPKAAYGARVGGSAASSYTNDRSCQQHL
jgi:hypothetical protein